MFSLLNSKKIRSWCLFDFGISSYPTLILTFFYGAFYAKTISSDPNVGTSLWGFALSAASILCFLLLSFILISGRNFFRNIKIGFFKFFFYLMIFFTFGLFFFDKGSNQFLPLFFIVISFVSFEIVNLFYNLSLSKIRKKNTTGALSNLGWAFGYLGGLASLFLVFMLLKFSNESFKIFNIKVFLLIGPFVAIWSALFGFSLFNVMKEVHFKSPNILELIKNVRSRGISNFLISYFFFNNAVVSIFAFASMIAAFIFGLSESEILFLGVSINFFGIIGCLVIGSVEDKMGSLNAVKICISGLLILTLILYFTESYYSFWVIALLVGFFIGPIQASSRSFLVQKIKAQNQMAAFSLYSMFGNLCSILGPFLVGLTIQLTDSIRFGIIVIPIFLFLSLIPFLKLYFRFNV
mgnify:FL=1